MRCDVPVWSSFVSMQSLGRGSAFAKGRVECQAKRLVLWHRKRKALMSY